ncbi:uncharacterized protein LOC124168734 [Ischnura elegans]|uniref:uncharacterized protein LOC124168734 n=1 Tax=Ischnura elegans TaxID=197161 RepID=UPI001ED86AB6|nr:uncharacterized protein LOC124168734 [Ischnura elegans]
MSAEDVQVLEELQQSWICGSCLASQRSVRGENTPLKPPAVPSDPSAAMLSEILERMKTMQSEQSELKKLVSQTQVTLGEHVSILTNMSESVSRLSIELKSAVSETATLKKLVCDLEARVNRVEQDSLKNSVEILGVPVEDGANVETLVCKIGQAMGLELTVEDIDHAYPINTRRGSQNTGEARPIIFVRFLRSHTAEAFIRARRAKGKMCLSHIGMSGHSARSPIYINESLTPAHRKLYAAARSLKREGKFKFLWVRGGRIFARIAEGGERLTISNNGDLDSLA